jgi:predicted nucleotidyltransferase
MSAAPSRSLPWEIAREYGDRLRSMFGARLRDVRVFGSYARGTAHEESDIDVEGVSI